MRIYSWQLYADSDCTELLRRGLHSLEASPRRQKWQITFEDAKPNELGIFPVSYTLLSGASRCEQISGILKLIPEMKHFPFKSLYIGKAAGNCNYRSMGLQEQPFVFSRLIDQTIEEYWQELPIAPLGRPGLFGRFFTKGKLNSLEFI